MNLSSRERNVAILTGAVIGLYLFFQVILDPLLARRAQVVADLQDANDKFDRNQRMFRASRLDTQRWKTMSRDALGDVASEAQAQVLHAVRDWAQAGGLSLSAVKPERSEVEQGFDKVAFRATGTGGMSQVARLLWEMENSPIPLRVDELQISARKEGTDDLNLTVGMSTIYLSPKTAGGTK